MKNAILIAGGVVLTLAGTGCATKKYVAKTMQPVESRVTLTETKNTDQDKAIATTSKQIEDLDRDLSRTKESLLDTNRQIATVATTAKAAGDRADAAGKSADGARTLAQQ